MKLCGADWACVGASVSIEGAGGIHSAGSAVYPTAGNVVGAENGTEFCSRGEHMALAFSSASSSIVSSGIEAI